MSLSKMKSLLDKQVLFEESNNEKGRGFKLTYASVTIREWAKKQTNEELSPYGQALFELLQLVCGCSRRGRWFAKFSGAVMYTQNFYVDQDPKEFALKAWKIGKQFLHESKRKPT